MFILWLCKKQTEDWDMSLQIQNMVITSQARRYGSMGVRVYKRSGERLSGAFGQVRRLHASSMENFVRWSLTRDVMDAGEHVSFSVFTIVTRGVHVSLTQFVDGELETRQWFFGMESSLESIFEALSSCRQAGRAWYVFTPGAWERGNLRADHPARSLDRAHIMSVAPDARVIHTECLAQLARGVMARRLGVDVRRWAEAVYSDGVYDGEEAEDCLTLAVRADSAMILRLMVMPASALCA